MFHTKVYDNLNVYGEWRYLLVYLSIILIFSQRFFLALDNEIGSFLRYSISIPLILSFKINIFDKKNIFLILFLIISIIFFEARLFILWTILGLSYQIYTLSIPVSRIISIGVIVSILMFIFIFILMSFSFIENKAFFAEKSKTAIYDLGFGHAGKTGLLILTFIEYLYLYMFKKYKSLYLVLSLILAFGGFYFTKSRTMLITVIILDFLAVFYTFKLFKPWLKYFIAILPVLFFILTFYLSSHLDSFELMNTMSTGRINLIRFYTDDFTPMTWIFGAKVNYENPLDSAYLDMILKGGLITAIFFCFSFYKSIIKYFKDVLYVVPFLISVLIAGLSESILTELTGFAVLFWVYTLMIFFDIKKVYRVIDN